MILSYAIIAFIVIQTFILLFFFSLSEIQKRKINKMQKLSSENTLWYDIEVIIAAKENINLLESCLDNVLLCGFKNIKVCCDGEPDEDIRILHERYPIVDFIRNEINQGKIKSQLQCLKNSDKETVLILDADIKLFPSEMAGFLAFYKQSKVDFLCPFSIGLNEGTNTLLFYVAEADRMVRQRIVRSGRDFFGVSNLSGYCLLANREKYIDIIDQDAIQDDVVATMNMLEKGYSVKTFPCAVCSELERSTFLAMLFQKTRWTAGNILLLSSYSKLFSKTTFPKAMAYSSSFILWYWALWIDMIAIITAFFFPQILVFLGVECILKYTMLNWVSPNKKMYFYNLVYIIVWPLFSTLCLIMCPFYLTGKINEQKTRR